MQKKQTHTKHYNRSATISWQWMASQQLLSEWENENIWVNHGEPQRQ